MEIRITGCNCLLPENFRLLPVSSEMNLSFVSGELVIDRSSPYFPERSDEKIMREDVKASVVAVQQMLAGYHEDLLAGTDLYVANGVFIEDTGKQLQRVIDLYRKLDTDLPETEKVQKLYQATPPLLALQTLTNSSMSFISQYAGIKGNNTTFGNTSQSAFYALQKAAASERALVCASNCGGAVSFLTFQSFFEDRDHWKESAAVACVFVNADETIPSLCRIVKIKTNNQSAASPGWHLLREDENATNLIFSGAFTEKRYVADLDYCHSFGKNPFSFFVQYGNCGSANLILSIVKAIELLASDPESIIDIFDRDPYGRESYIRIVK